MAKNTKQETVDLMITSAVMINGKMVVPGKGDRSIVTVSSQVATNLLRRGKAALLTAEDVELDKLKVDELQDIAAELEIEGRSGMNKAELIEAIEAAEAGE